MTIGGLGAYGDIYASRVNQSTKVKNASSNVFSKTMATMTEASAYNREPIRDSEVSRHTEYTDPETEKNVPVDIRYTTFYSEDGITCRKSSDVGDKSSEKELWKLSFASSKEYEKVQDFLKSFSADDNLTFATQENFWKDFLKDDFNVDDFKNYYDTTNNGLVDIEKAMSAGKKLRETLTEKNAEYLNNSHFVGRVYTEEDLQPSWYRNGRVQISEVYDPSVPRETTVTSTVGLRKPAEITSTKEMSLEEYKNYIHDKISSFKWQMDNMGDSCSVDISDEGFKAMQNDPEYERWVLEDLKTAFATPMPGWTRSIGGTKYQVVHYGATKEECHSTSWWTGYQNGTGDKFWEAQSKGSFWTKRAEQKKIQDRIDKKVAEKKEIEEKWMQETAAKRRAYTDFLNGKAMLKTSGTSGLSDFFSKPTDTKIAGII